MNLNGLRLMQLRNEDLEHVRAQAPWIGTRAEQAMNSACWVKVKAVLMGVLIIHLKG